MATKDSIPVYFLAKHISVPEYRCHHCGKLPPGIHILFPLYHQLFSRFDLIRKKWGKPLIITSGYRCPDYNKAIGGAPASIHTFGLALDIHCESVEMVDQLAKVIEDVAPELRRGEYREVKKYIHIDMGWLIVPPQHSAWAPGVRWKE